MSPKSKKREPSLELQRQIEDSIAARSRHEGIVSRALEDDTTNTSNNAVAVEPGTPPLGANFEYLDHPADIILHSWGVDLPEALENLVVCLFGYITSIDAITINEVQSEEHGTNITGQGHDLHSLIFSFLDEWLFGFHDSGFVPKEVKIHELRRDVWRVASSGKGEVMDIMRHPQGTEVKAITYNGMKVEMSESTCDVYVVVDI